MEVEWQLDALDLRPVERWLSLLPARARSAPPGTALDVPNLVPQTAAPKELQDVYLDTEDWRIGRAGFVLRVRHRNGGDEVTLKDTTPATAGLRRRLEVSEPLPPDGITALGSAGPVGRRVHALAGNQPLRPVLEVRTRRAPTTLRSGGTTIAEVALDDTTLSIGAGEEPARLQRVEVEVDAAWVEALEPLVEQMQRDCGLQPAALSKFEVGLLAAGVTIPAPPDLGPTEVTADSAVGEVAFAVLRRNFSALLAHEPGTRLGEDIEELHDMRVATRRLRAALDLFADSLPVRAARLRTELGWLAGVLGSVRDLDVQIERLDGWFDEVPATDRAALAELATLLERERDGARRALLKALDSARYKRLVAGFTTMASRGPTRRSVAARTPAVVVVPELLRARHRAVTKAARRARRSGLPADFHRVRIRCKRLRYALEFVADVYDRRTTPVVRSVVPVQDLLGAIQDAEVAARRLHDLAIVGGHALSTTTVFAMGGIAERYRHEAHRLLAKAPKRLQALQGPQWHRLSSFMERRRDEAGAPWVVPAAPVPPLTGGPGADVEPAPAAPPPTTGSPAPGSAGPDRSTPDSPVPGSALSTTAPAPPPDPGRRGEDRGDAAPPRPPDRVVVPSHLNLADPGHSRSGPVRGTGNGNGSADPRRDRTEPPN